MRRIIVSLALFCSLFSAFDSLAQSQPAELEAEAQSQPAELEAELNKRLVDITDNLASYTLGLFLVTALLAVVTGGLVYLGYRQERLTKITTRAYLSVEPEGIDRWRGQNTRVLGHVGVRNSGHSPARAVTWTLHIEFDNDGSRTDFPITRKPRYGPVITSGMTMRRGTPNVPPGKQQYCYVWGEIRYDDGLGKPRHTKFCHRYNCGIKSFANARRINPRHARYHEFGNDAD